VVLSSVLAYMVALGAGAFSWWHVFVLTAGGFLTTAAANVLNEVLEKDYDRQMERTRTRPLAEGRLSSSDALLIAGFSSIGGITLLARLTLFTIQFFWQLPHFYAIGYLGYEDYAKAGFKLVPERNGAVDAVTLGRDAVIAAVVLLPLAAVPYFLGVTSIWAAGLVVLLSGVFLHFALAFRADPGRKTALGMMFFSFAYLPLAFTVYWLGQQFIIN